MIKQGKEVDIQSNLEENVEFLKNNESAAEDVDVAAPLDESEQDIDIREDKKPLNESEENKVQLV